MTSTTTATPDFNLDDWIDSVQRTERAVTLYGRMDLMAEIDVLQAKLRAEAEIPEEDRSMGGDPSEKLRQEIDDLYIQIDASKIEIRVSFLDDEEQEAISTAVRKELKAEADAAAKQARADGVEKCKRLEIKAVNDVNQMCRNLAAAAAEHVFEREINVRTIAAAVVSPRMTPDQVRKLYKVVGDAQIALISKAYTRASIEEPQVTVPKSSQPSHNDDGLTSS
ncbi:hypothetical protein ASF72_10625 [Arthrobacter sp. Leaf141]|uniref:hypothetical protein n=1 Tax=Arthrobacter sp. Leaf141 TaxID=1736273 RepID=UPI0007006B50|nr:hypothetical protein [Arthrobacter sp. Leaf141]KQR02480.1 hypothetical protein ASF72_10625 [Arthrobacter sp. Leaf141]